VKLGCEANLRVDDAVVGEIFNALPGYPAKRLGSLEHGDCVRERLQVEHEVATVCTPVEPFSEFIGISRRQLVAGRLRQFDNSRGTKPPSRWSCKSTLGASRS
jgi:hypothetical protein